MKLVYLLVALLLLPSFVIGQDEPNESPASSGPEGASPIDNVTQALNLSKPAYDPLRPDQMLEGAAASIPLLNPVSAQLVGNVLFADDFNDNSLSSQWTVLNNGFGVAETNQRLEMKVREGIETTATVQGPLIYRSFSSTIGIDASLEMARKVATGGGRVADVSFEIFRGADPSKWVKILYSEWPGTVTLTDSAGNSATLANYGTDADQPIGFHSVRLTITGGSYTGWFDSTSFTRSSSLFSGATSLRLRFQDSTGGSSYGSWETSARDSVVVREYSTAANTVPNPPSQPSGASAGYTNSVLSYSTAGVDPNGGDVWYEFDWGDGTARTGSPWTTSGTTQSASHAWASPGTYYIYALTRDPDGAPSGWSSPKQVTISNVATGDSYEPDDTFNQYTYIYPATYVQSQSRSVNPAGDNDYMLFYAYAGYTYTFYSDGTTDTYGRVYNYGQTQLVFDDDAGAEYNFWLQFTPQSTGYHYLKVHGYSPSTVGSYTLNYYYAAASNSPPTACINQPSISGRTVTVTSCSTDPNSGDTLTLTWAWGDGTFSSGVSPSPHTYACPGGTYWITLTADDGHAGTHSTQRSVSTSEPDSDGDTLKDCQETGTYMTSPSTWDTDGDGLSDGAELSYWNGISSSAWNTNWDRFSSSTNNLLKWDADADGIKDGYEFIPPGSIFGNAAGSCSSVGGRNECPAANVRDLYVQLNWMVQPDSNCFYGYCFTPGHSDKPAAADLVAIRANFDNHNAASVTKDQVRLHLYEGRYGDGAGSVKLDGTTPLPHTNQIYFDRTTTTGGASDDLYDYKEMAFPMAPAVPATSSRLGYFHFLFFGHQIKDGQGTVAGGMGEVFGNDAAISRNNMTTTTDVVGGVMHELGHNLMGEYHSLTCYNGFPPGHAGHGYYHNLEAASVLNLTTEGRLGKFDEGRNSDGACGTPTYQDGIDDVWTHSGRSDDAMGFNYVNRATSWSNAGWNALHLNKAVVLIGNGNADDTPVSALADPEHESPELLWFLDSLRDGTGAMPLHADPVPSLYHDHEH